MPIMCLLHHGIACRWILGLAGLDPLVQEMHADVAMHLDLGACEGNFGMEKLRAVTGAVICPRTSR